MNLWWIKKAILGLLFVSIIVNGVGVVFSIRPMEGIGLVGVLATMMIMVLYMFWRTK